jgi:hypothetical protein
MNERTGHFVLLGDEEAAAVERGSAGPGWVRTGQSFTEVAYTGSIEPPLALRPVCRFYSPLYNSHFFTANPDECASLKRPGREWVFEKNAFFVTDVGPVCLMGQPIYRVYNNRHAVGDAAHRFTPDAATRDQMIAAGFVDEGVAWCSNKNTFGPKKSYVMFDVKIADASSCDGQVGACVRLVQQPALPNLVQALTPDYPQQTLEVTGEQNLDVHTAQSVDNPDAIIRHSFVQLFKQPSVAPIGFHVTSLDRTGAGPYASMSAMYVLPGGALGSRGGDEPLFPWSGPQHRTLVFTMFVQAATVKRADASSHAYGTLVAQFATTSGRSFYVTVQVYGTVPPGDFTAPDVTTGQPIVSTVFRADPAFGASHGAQFVACDGQSSCTSSRSDFEFRMTDADFAKALQRARTLDPALSADTADYFVAQFRMQNEIYGDAEIGASVDRFSMQLY